MKIKELPGGCKEIIISDILGTPLKKANLAWFLLATFVLVRLVFNFGPRIDYTWRIFYLYTGVVVYLIVGFKFLNKAFATEKLKIATGCIAIIKKNAFSEKKVTYDNAFISGLRYVTVELPANIIINEGSFDVYKFEEERRKKLAPINNKIAFEYKGQTVFFGGESLTEYEFEEIKATIESLKR